MPVKHSAFNFNFKRNKNENIIYNTFSKALVVLDDDEFAQFKQLSFENKFTQDTLIENGILINKHEDEIAFLKYFHYKTKFTNKSLFLTIAPTLDCNFACPYCYENRRKGIMSKDIQSAVINYIKKSIEGGIDKLNVTWYGGEPLLCFEIVESMSKKIVNLCAKKNCLLKMDIVTNGYLLTEDIVEKLDLIGVTRIQITIDGLKENHDRRRPLRGGDGSFDKIYNNLFLFDNSPLSVLIRMNVDNENCDDFKKLKTKIDEIENKNIKVYASPVEDINPDKINNVTDFMSSEEFEAFALKTCDEGDWCNDDFSVMDDRYCFCTAETENCYVVDNQGDFYKCWDEVGRKEYVCFNILNENEINYHQIAKFVADDPFSDEKCAKCVFLPLCFGGCKFQKHHSKDSNCGFTDESVRKYIETTFLK